MNEFWWLWWPMISGVSWGLSFPDICRTVEEKIRKKPRPEKVARPGIEPGPARWEQRRYPLAQRWSNLNWICDLKKVHFHFWTLNSEIFIISDWYSTLRKATGSYRTYSSLVKLQRWFLSLRWKICLWAELQAWCLNLQWKTCPWAEHSDDDDILHMNIS